MEISFSEFMQVEIRVGKVIAATDPEWSNKLLELTVDLGEEETRTILAGVKEWYDPAEFEGKKYQFVANLEEKKMGEGLSQGMMLMGDADGKPVPIPVNDQVPVGTKVR